MEKNKLIALVKGAQKGDSAAVDALFAAYYNDVYYFALKTLKDQDLACDITQETFLEIINTIHKLETPEAFVTWMKQITYHQCTRYFKKKKEVLVEEDEDGNTVFDTLADEGAIPAEIYEQAEFRQTIHSIIDQLTEEQRSAVMLYYFDELTVGQIAKIQGVSDGTVKSRLNYARKALKKSVESYEKKHNVKLHSVAILPLLLLFFGKALMPQAKAAEIGAVVSQAASTAAGTAAAAATAKVGMSLAAKIIAGVAAVAVVAGVGVGTVALRNNKEKPSPDAAQDPDSICDDYGEDTCSTEEAAADRCTGDWRACDEDNDFICDVTGEPLCGAQHLNCHFADNRGDNSCMSCGAPVIVMPEVYIAEDVLCIIPGQVGARGYAYDSVDAEFEIYDLDTGELICKRLRWDFPLESQEGMYGNIYNVGKLAHEAAIKIPVSQITDAATCNIGVRAKSLDENYASTGINAVKYMAASARKPLNVTVDAAGVLHIENYDPQYNYYIYETTNAAYCVWYDDGSSGGSIDLHQANWISPPQDGGYPLLVYETVFPDMDVYAKGVDGIPVFAGHRSFLPNCETAFFPATREEYEAMILQGPGPEPME